MTADPMDRLRAICLAQPGATERISHAEPTWYARNKRVFAMFAGEHHDDRVAVWLAADAGVQEGLIESAPTRFFRPPYVGVKGWVGIYLDIREVDWDEVAALVADANAVISRRR